MSTQDQSLAVFDTLLAEVTIAVKPILEIKVDGPDSEKIAQSAGAQVSHLMKQVEKRRKELLAPLKLQVDAINAAAKKVEAILGEPDTHIRKQLNDYSTELNRKRAEELRLQMEKEAAERKAAEDKRRKEDADLRAKQEADRKAIEEAARAENKRIADQLEADKRQAELEASKRAGAANLFGRGSRAKEEAEAVSLAAEQKAATERKALEDRQAQDAKVLADNQERERIAEQARLDREEEERQKTLEFERKLIEAQRVKGSKLEIEITVRDAWAVPREFLRAPEIKVNEIKSAYKLGRRDFPGLTIKEDYKVSLRSEGVTA